VGGGRQRSKPVAKDLNFAPFDAATEAKSRLSAKDVAARFRHLSPRPIRFVGSNIAPVSDTTLLKGREMARTDLVEVTMAGWARLNPSQRERFFQAGLKAALRLERQEFRDWLLRRIGEPPLAAPVDPARFAISKTDIALLMRSTREKSGAASATPAKCEVGAQ
jgi:hypothetical protein